MHPCIWALAAASLPARQWSPHPAPRSRVVSASLPARRWLSAGLALFVFSDCFCFVANAGGGHCWSLPRSGTGLHPYRSLCPSMLSRPGRLLNVPSALLTPGSASADLPDCWTPRCGSSLVRQAAPVLPGFFQIVLGFSAGAAFWL